jgi:uncharacterized membrane protein
VGEPWTFAWTVVTQRYPAVAVPIIVAYLVMVLPGYILNFGGGLLSGILRGLGLDYSVASAIGSLTSLAGSAVTMVLSAYVLGGLVDVALKAVRGQPTQLRDAFAKGRLMVPMLLAMVVNAILVTIGMVLLIVPGVIVAIGLSMYAPLIVDQGLSGIDALKRSWEITKGHKMNLFLFGLVAIVLACAGVVACMVGALLLSLPLSVVAWAWVYLRIKGEPIGQTPAMGPAPGYPAMR